MNPLATRVGVAYSDEHYRLGREFADLDHHGSRFVAQPLVRGRHFDITAQVQCNENLEQHAVAATEQRRVARLNR
ncbi:hypothetical protein [Burkholderia ambifaria]|uniref:hypothetical protein n=1 Tax=Burkholderia ambifaria TaxID=152480 RepID=UPI000D0012F6|nr:hypothetical protein [Burkholderia ambifaria]MBR8183373.1 hypothetical protein [Burkholderia ambifaria]PRG05617.1 hypothetical protein C6Q14_13080 [Burkholderia ambifaria]